MASGESSKRVASYRAWVINALNEEGGGEGARVAALRRTPAMMMDYRVEGGRHRDAHEELAHFLKFID
jgi:hypothetical protein